MGNNASQPGKTKKVESAPLDIPASSSRTVHPRAMEVPQSRQATSRVHTEELEHDTDPGFTPGSWYSNEDSYLAYGQALTPEQPQVIPFADNTPLVVAKPAADPTSAEAQGKDTIPTVFEWAATADHVPQTVYVVGSWGDWQTALPLARSHSDFSTILYLPKGQHQYKFIVDGEWSYSAEKPTAVDNMGNVNNVVEVKDVEGISSKERVFTLPAPPSPPGSYTREIPSEHIHSLAYDKPPPVFPPHLRVPILSKPSEDDPDALPVPHHVMLNHLTILSVKDSVMVLGCTTRLRNKYITTVVYKPFTRRRSSSHAPPVMP